MTSRLRLADLLRSGLATLILPVLVAPILMAQAVPPSPPEEPIHTLHVYMDLIQIPVLVLDSEMELMKPIDASRFRISLDSGPVFHPRTVRPEGDDPISLAILLDANAEPDLMPRISDAISSLAPGSLHPADHISIYGLDCSLTRSLLNVPANPVLLKEAVDRALAKWTERHQTRHARPCPQKLQLWDAMGYLVKQLREVPGRRVMLVVSDGSDHGSVATWSDIRSFTQEAGVAVFGYSTPNVRNSAYRIGPAITDGHAYRSSGMLPSVRSGNSPEDPFNLICQLSGGIVLAADDRFLPKDLARFITLVRSRYIVEFARARNDTPGQHSILVTIDKSPTAYVRPAGVVITMRDAAIDADPSTIPRDATDAPVLGKRKPIH